ncbi:hypothetical protein BDR03DRAFT_681478 [Suillus americanus]|nr:hypothetical protein BDR03DRAFT_681478 [Suillus americanus]
MLLLIPHTVTYPLSFSGYGETEGDSRHPFLRDTSTHPTHTQIAHARYTYPTSPCHRDFPKPDGRCFMACTFLHSSRIHIAWNCKSFAASIHSKVFLSILSMSLCMVHSFIFCIATAPCFICFYRFLSRLEVHLCDIYVLGKRSLTMKPFTIILFRARTCIVNNLK